MIETGSLRAARFHAGPTEMTKDPTCANRNIQTDRHDLFETMYD
jgi:hypothetical protein